MNFKLVAIACLLFSAVYAENVCDDGWEPFKEEKCIKLMDKVTLRSFADAKQICAENNSNLISLTFHDDQPFLENYLYNYVFKLKTVVDNVWLGAKNTLANQDIFTWQDGSSLTFVNWAPNNPNAHSTETCVQMDSDQNVRGRWFNVACAKKNLVVCEKGQNWSLSKVQQMVVKLLKNPVPIGFIYTQLPNEKSPQEIWPWMSWTEVSSNYEGVFFRVAGGGAAGFGTVQEESSPRIDEIKHSECQGREGCPGSGDVRTSQSGGWSGEVFSAAFTNGEASAWYNYLNFHTTGGEVRPRNMAVKVWKRIA